MQAFINPLKNKCIYLDAKDGLWRDTETNTSPSSHLLTDLSEWREIKGDDKAHLTQQLQQAKREESIQTSLLFFFDPSLPERLIKALAHEIESALQEAPSCLQPTLNLYYATPFPLPKLLTQRLELLWEIKTHLFWGGLRPLLRHQPLIKEVGAAWSRLSIEDAYQEDLNSLEGIRSEFISRGAFHALVHTLSRGESTSYFLKKGWKSGFIKTTNEANLLKKWSKPFFNHSLRSTSNNQMGEDIQKWVEKMQIDTLSFLPSKPKLSLLVAKTIITEQKKTSLPIHIGKSLSKLAKECKTNGWHEMQLTFAKMAAKENPYDVQCLTQVADAYKSNKELKKALLLYQQASFEFPQNVVAQNGKAEVLRELGQTQDALNTYSETIKLFPQAVVAFCGKAEVLRELGQTQDALDTYAETIKLFPQNEVARNGKAEVLRELGQTQDALNIYTETINLFPQDVVARNGKAEVLRELGQTQDALDIYAETIQLFPQDVVAFCGKAEVLRELGQTQDALNIYTETLQLFPQAVVPKTGLATLEASLGNFTKALALLPPSEEGHRDWISSHIRGMIYLKQGNLQEAIKIFQAGAEQCNQPKSKLYYQVALDYCRIKDNNAQTTLSNLKPATQKPKVLAITEAYAHAKNKKLKKAISLAKELSDSKIIHFKTAGKLIHQMCEAPHSSPTQKTVEEQLSKHIENEILLKVA